ncbi:hypothetical protein [Actinoplanes derwentensis]|uniref:Secreted protein n=1 Tax=Actinoplanes derwentensis TaxID=113562 RepID=A0A1H1TTQ7_9ACTN|nr:hypothetical protein [Actinoplanes derwentensis]GID85133.1 hypothetical protein Ade03nite_40570 [Actinoplanes derwentensis]SDS63592.1 hypothetical protein SAMN04489716_1239 [Actinoplanes derwentensis]
MNRTMRLLVTGTGLIAGAMFLAGPALATTECCQPEIPVSTPESGTASHSPKPGDPEEEIVTNFHSGPWFPAPVGVN